ncbi:dynactin subunit 4-like isoform X2 [Apostichopus japonicus]|uniref:dynactin subunit 4-like isoform X2 n=1 Tax=Stichopus japonicus TaxID=307972 RepID=UPI003AB7FAE6
MATLLQFEKVLLKCSCGIKSPIISLYFCKHCLKLRCGRCVSHEVDSYSCPNCLENMPSAEAKLKKNRCANCLDCPSCNHSLTTRATSVALTDAKSPEKKTTKKVYYLACGLCRWTSRDIGLTDKESASGGWEEYENNHAERLNNLLEFYHQLAIKEKNEREQKKFTKRRTYLRLQEKYFSPGGLTTRRKTSFLSALSSLAPKTDEPEVTPVSKIPPCDEVDPLPSKFYTQPLVLEKVTTLAQRLNRPEFASNQVEGLYPRHKHLVIKRSQRCRDCEHNLSKPEYNPSSIKFKIQLVALQHIPDIRIYLVPKLHHERESIVTILLSNPSQEPMEIQLEALNHPPSTGMLIVPSIELALAAKDITAEFDEKVADTSQYQDNPEFIQFRSGHKLGVLFKVTPQTSEADVVVCFKLKHKYHNNSPSLRSPPDEESSPEAIWLEHEVHINLGPTSP